MSKLIKQKTIGINPLDEYLSYSTSNLENKETANSIDMQQNKDNNIDLIVKSTIKKERITLHISSDIINKIKNVVYWEPGLTMAAFAELALYKALNDLEQERGESYPERKTHNLRLGRPIK